VAIALLKARVDTQNHFYTSLLVSLGLGLSFVAEHYGVPWLHYADAAASTFIGYLILTGALELIQEYRKSDNDEVSISHFSVGLKRT
jgi:divalent metal cation (Fe/Co/Zn/Cd) transporter